MAVVIFITRVGAVMAQSKVVIELMRGGFGNVSLVTCETVEINPGRPVGGEIGLPERIDISPSARGGHRVVVPVGIRAVRDQHVGGAGSE